LLDNKPARRRRRGGLSFSSRVRVIGDENGAEDGNDE
jgi:hypothetical protein